MGGRRRRNVLRDVDQNVRNISSRPTKPETPGRVRSTSKTPKISNCQARQKTATSTSAGSKLPPRPNKSIKKVRRRLSRKLDDYSDPSDDAAKGDEANANVTYENAYPLTAQSESRAESEDTISESIAFPRSEKFVYARKRRKTTIDNSSPFRLGTPPQRVTLETPPTEAIVEPQNASFPTSDTKESAATKDFSSSGEDMDCSSGDDMPYREESTATNQSNGANEDSNTETSPLFPCGTIVVDSHSPGTNTTLTVNLSTTGSSVMHSHGSRESVVSEITKQSGGTLEELKRKYLRKVPAVDEVREGNIGLLSKARKTLHKGYEMGITDLQSNAESKSIRNLEQWSIDYDDDDATSAVFFEIVVAGKHYVHPPMPPGWRLKISQTRNRPYYFHPDYGRTWTCPVVLPVRDPKVKSVAQKEVPMTPDTEFAKALGKVDKIFPEMKPWALDDTPLTEAIGRFVADTSKTSQFENDELHNPPNSEESSVKVTQSPATMSSSLRSQSKTSSPNKPPAIRSSPGDTSTKKSSAETTVLTGEWNGDESGEFSDEQSPLGMDIVYSTPILHSRSNRSTPSSQVRRRKSMTERKPNLSPINERISPEADMDTPEAERKTGSPSEDNNTEGSSPPRIGLQNSRLSLMKSKDGALQYSPTPSEQSPLAQDTSSPCTVMETDQDALEVEEEPADSPNITIEEDRNLESVEKTAGASSDSKSPEKPATPSNDNAHDGDTSKSAKKSTPKDFIIETIVSHQRPRKSVGRCTLPVLAMSPKTGNIELANFSTGAANVHHNSPSALYESSPQSSWESPLEQDAPARGSDSLTEFSDLPLRRESIEEVPDFMPGGSPILPTDSFSNTVTSPKIFSKPVEISDETHPDGDETKDDEQLSKGEIEAVDEPKEFDLRIDYELGKRMDTESMKESTTVVEVSSKNQAISAMEPTGSAAQTSPKNKQDSPSNSEKGEMFHSFGDNGFSSPNSVGSGDVSGTALVLPATSRKKKRKKKQKKSKFFPDCACASMRAHYPSRHPNARICSLQTFFSTD